MFSYKFYSKPSGKLMLRIVSERKKAELAMGVSLSQERLDNALSDKPDPENAKWKQVLSLYRAKIEAVQCALAEEGRRLSAAEARDKLQAELLGEEQQEPEPAPEGFRDFYLRIAKAKERPRYTETMLHTLSRADAYDADLADRSFEDITPKWLLGFDDFMRNSGSCANTRAIHMRNLRTVMNRAIDEELTDSYPFRRFKIKTEETKKRSLTAKQLREVFDSPSTESERRYVDYFKLVFMLIGINLVDLYSLAEITAEGRIEYRRAKTHRLYSIKVEPEAMEIIKKYKGKKGLLCFADSWADHRNFGRKLNKALQSLGAAKAEDKGKPKGKPKGKAKDGKGKDRKAKSKGMEPKGRWPGLSLYWARHTWATIAAELDIPDAVISLALGHSSGNRVTNIYIRRNLQKVDDANRRVLDFVLYGKR